MAVYSTGVPAGAVASTFGHEINYVNLREGLTGLPQLIGIFATFDPTKTAVVANVPIRVFTEVEAGEKFGFGFPAHLAARQTLRKSGIVPVYIFPIAEAGGAVAGDGNILFSVTSTSSGTLSIYIGGQEVRVNIDKATAPAAVATAVAAAITADINLPVDAAVNGGTAEQVDITSKYKGAIAQDILIALNLTEAEKDATPGGTTAVITGLTSGAGVPLITTALGNISTDWYTYFVNTFGVDTDVMDEFEDYNEDNQWDTLVNRPFRAYYGSVEAIATQTALTDARTLDRTNSAIPYENGYMLPLELAALAVGQLAALNQNNPPTPETGLLLDNLLVTRSSGNPWTYTQRNAAVNAGTSTVIIEDSIIKLEDVVMHYHKAGEVPPAFRWSVDINKINEWIYNVDLIFKSENWRGKILVADTDIVSNPNARRPKDAVAEIFKLADAASEAAIITRPEFTKANTAASVDIANPNRLNITTLIVLSGATRIISLTTNFGFNFGALTS